MPIPAELLIALVLSGDENDVELSREGTTVNPKFAQFPLPAPGLASALALLGTVGVRAIKVEGTSPTDYVDAAADALADLPGWKVSSATVMIGSQWNGRTWVPIAADTTVVGLQLEYQLDEMTTAPVFGRGSVGMHEDGVETALSAAVVIQHKK